MTPNEAKVQGAGRSLPPPPAPPQPPVIRDMTIKAKDATSNASVPKLATESGSAETSQADNALRAEAQRQESNAAHESSSNSDESDKVADDKPADVAEQIAAPAGVMIE